MSEVAFFKDLAVIMAAAGFASVLFSRLKWPKVLGYILVGCLMSRHVWGGAIIVDESSVQTLGQLGIVFLMFAMGLGFSTSSLKKIGHVTLPTALVDTVMMTWIGFTIGRNVLEWGTVPSLFLGVAVCDSATTLLAKIIDELDWGGRPFVKYVLGTSVCEDIICIGLIALVTGVAGGKGLDVVAIGKSLGALGVFFISTIVFGMVLVPKFLDVVAKKDDDEALLLALLGCCFFVSFIAYRLDFSLALGAFLVGLLGASTEVRERLRSLTDPLRTMFAAVFFVSIGLLVNPVEVFLYLPYIILVSAAVAVFKGLDCFVGAMATGLSLKSSIQIGFSLAQIGEFAFMVAMLYVTLTGDTTKPMFQIVVGASLITTLANPFMIKISDKVGDWADSRIPERIKHIHDGYRGFIKRYHESSGIDRRHAVVRASLLRLGLVCVLGFAVAFVFSSLNGRNWSSLSVFFDLHKSLFFCLAMNAILFSMGVVVFSTARKLALTISEIIVGKGDARWQQAIQHVVRFVVMTAVCALAFVELLMININLAPAEPWARITVVVVFVLAAVFGWRFFVHAVRRANSNFTSALAIDARLQKLSREITFSVPENAVKYIPVAVGSPAVGENVVSLNIRSRTGATVVSVRRQGHVNRGVGPEWTFKAGDGITAIGDEDQLAALEEMLAAKA